MNTYKFRYLDGELWEDWNREQVSSLLDNETADSDFDVRVFEADQTEEIESRLKKLPVKMFLQDLLRDDSALVGLFRERFDGEDAKAVKMDIFLRFFRELSKIDGTVDIFSTKKYDGMIYLSKGPITFGVRIPCEFLDNKFGPDHPRFYSVPYIGELGCFTPDEILTYVAPYYYLDIGAYDRQPLRDSREDMERLISNWPRMLLLEVG